VFCSGLDGLAALKDKGEFTSRQACRWAMQVEQWLGGNPGKDFGGMCTGDTAEGSCSLKCIKPSIHGPTAPKQCPKKATS
jgi:hypothetical protein